MTETGLTYPEAGATREPPLPPGYHHLRHRARLSHGSLPRAAEELLTWRVHARLGLRPVASAPRAAPGVTVVCRLGPLRIPCRVVWTVEEDRRAGFAYGTLPGHPEIGEESFMVERDAGGTLWFTLTAFSRPARLPRLTGPAAAIGQHLFARLYTLSLRYGLRR
ncbi:DUF1990 domain-containing protein [Microtetraspora sp. NBRC 13810]|uniref:DUF1990 family protein n=1 Tax=Microtetraspora sp. NBRC 13810 TaxID=3030990 RepID=UPI0024A291A7|nr:DUF1990 domain-containing protein [Microtetraspora sp. NBRC 13810]GLW13022.1 DUF1990 domain-containing protein [Microtetraspora sp. NBRC 13810]